MTKISSIILSFIVMISCNSNSASESLSTPTPSQQKSFQIVNQYPHNVTSFTEGLEYRDSCLYESTGLNGTSKLSKIDINTGKDLLTINLDKKYFGEGITIINNKIFQLTYQEEKCFVYDLKTFKKLQEFSYKGEGWGMTNDGKQIINSNGSNNLYYRNANSFAEENIIAIFDENGPLANINELEYVDGFIYANVWYKNYIVKIDPKQGKVVAKYDFTGIINQYMPNLHQDAVINGIAYNSTKATFYITGKNWPLLFEVKMN
ncbi:MAG: glutaminyl-peptide cyclotransferase [Chitinophagaceae bacterium]|nr:glutaminyl-peptide cyclotransferase [Chitinophagaceae bacterium]